MHCFTFAKVAFSMLENKIYIEKMNALAKAGTPFLFVIDFLAENPLIYPLHDIPEGIHFSTPGFPETNKIPPKRSLTLEKTPVCQADYELKFSQVLKHILHGNSFLVNLTQPTELRINWSLEDIYYNCGAPYKLLIKNQFVVFSPEIFIRIIGQKIETYPMKGTIDASLPNAKEIILNDDKETAEHFTIVDLMRNDLSQIATEVSVEKFRFVERIQTNEKDILQVSSKITAQLPEGFRENLGTMLFKLLPAGSISGAPKKKTLEILDQTEGYKRGYYTGIFGVFDGQNLDSAVMIRYIEQSAQGFTFKSGGGITSRSEPEKEYQELKDKVYVPIIGNHTNK